MNEEDILLVALGKTIYFTLYIIPSNEFTYFEFYKIIGGVTYHIRTDGSCEETKFTLNAILNMFRGEIYEITGRVKYILRDVFSSEKEMMEYKNGRA